MPTSSPRNAGEITLAPHSGIPHITDAIKAKIIRASEGVEITIVEIGGTVGDIESQPFLEAIRQLSFEMG